MMYQPRVHHACAYIESACQSAIYPQRLTDRGVLMYPSSVIGIQSKEIQKVLNTKFRRSMVALKIQGARVKR